MKKISRHILLIEASLSGHHSIYLERTALAFTADGHQVTVALPITLKETLGELNVVFANSAINLFWYEPSFNLNSTGTLGLLQREYGVWSAFKRIFLTVQAKALVHYVFLPYMDYCLYAMGLLGSPFSSTPYSGICMRPSFHHIKCGVIAPSGRIDTAKRYLFGRLLRNKHLVILFTIDELLPSFITANSPKEALKRLVYLPDPANDATAVNVPTVRAEFNTPEAAKVMLVYGALDERKGVFHLLDALESSHVLDDWYVWFIGKQSVKVGELLAGSRWSKLKARSRICVRNEFVNTETEQKAFGACTAVWVAYDGHFGMSGVLVHAGLHSKPVIACPEGLIGWYAKQRGVGLVVGRDGASIQATLLILSQEDRAAELGAIGFEQFKLNSWSNFAALVVKTITNDSN